ncbi:protein kinase domain protein, partial [Ichthyophthirius multifiliis]
MCILQNFNNNYVLQEILGTGSFAVVCKISRIIDQKTFAAKIIKLEKLQENKHKEKFFVINKYAFSYYIFIKKNMLINEYKALKKCRHKNIAKLEEVYQEQTQLIYVTEYIQGGELYQRLKKIKNFKEEDAAMIIYNITQGLQYMHNQQLVHRDLKLENILLVNHIDLDCKIIDFGFAEKINYQKLESRAGTHGFLPPELFKLQPYTEKGDIFSLGVILFCLLSGQSPFKGKTSKEVLENNKKCKISYDSDIWIKISDESKYLLKKMLEVDPNKRFKCNEILKSKWLRKYILNNSQSLKSSTHNKTKNSLKN